MSRRAIAEDVTPPDTIEPMAPIRRILKLVAAGIGFALYVWYAAVRAAPSVKRRKALRRAAR
jgi:hypothetical protein